MPQASPDRPAVVRFGPFTLDLRSGELSRNGTRTRLQDQPLALLRCLIEHPGRLVTRDELRRRLWPNGTVVDFEHGVNTALKRLRDALGDEAEHPVYIETVPRRGYRFLAAVEVVRLEEPEPGVANGADGLRNGALRPGAGLRSPASPSAYRILEQIGAGGMGEVYRAEDLTLKRKVAVKVLPAAFANDPDRLARFQREAEVLASLNHPHICTLHAMGEARPEELGVPGAESAAKAPAVSRRYLVMEYLDGQTLAARLEKGPLPAALVCDLGAQVADALAAAHRHGVVHRDLKPANIMLTRTSSARAGVPHVKLLDFGLAKLAGHGEQPALALDSGAATHCAGLTGQGTVLGTLPYMAPEQIDGKDADARTDIWALGAVLYEMATGKPAFAADSFASLAGQILTAQPAPIAAHQPLAPPALEHVVSTCLAKDPEARWQSASDVGRELHWIADEFRLGRTPSSGVSAEMAAARAADVRLRRWRITSAAGALVALLAGAGAVWLWAGKAQPFASSPPVARSLLGVAPAENIYGSGLYPIVIPTPGGARTAMTWTQDGRALVFVGRVGNTPQLYVRRLDENESRLLEGTQGARLPAVSPDGKWIAFYQRGTIKKVPLEGGPVFDVSSEAAGYPPFGLAWDDTGTLYYDRPLERGIWVIPPGGKARALTTPRLNMTMHSHPWPLPGGRALIYTNRKRCCTWGDEEIVVQPLPAGEPKVLVVDGADARYLPPGYLVFMRRGVLFAASFDVERLEVRSTPVPVLDNVLQSLWAGNPYDASGIGQFAVSPAGHLAYLRGPLVPIPPNELVSIDKSGRVTVLPAPVDSYNQLRLSPDGQRLAVGAGGLTEMAVYVYDLTRRTMHAVSRDAEAGNLVWTRDGQRLLFQLNRNGSNSMVAQAADGTGLPQTLLPDSEFFPVEMRPDGKAVAGFTLAGGRSEAQLVTLNGDAAQVAPFPQMAGPTQWPAFSPDGRWLAYGSAMSNRNEVYVQAYPGPGTRVPVSVEGGYSPAWHPNGREIYFLSLAAANQFNMMAVDFTPGSPPRVGRPRPLFTFDGQKLMLMCVWFRCYDVSSDGERFYGWQQTVRPNPAPVTHINLIMNWFEELKAKVPVTRRSP